MAGTLKHAKTSGKAAPTDTTKVGGPDWDADHVFAGGALGSLLYRDTGSTDGVSWLADVAAGSILVSGGIGAAPAWSATPSLTDLTLTGKLKAADGLITAPSITFASAPTYGLYLKSSGVQVTAGVTSGAVASFYGSDLRLTSTMALGWSNGFSDASGADVNLFRDAANTLAQRNSTNAQVFRLYNTYPDASNNEFGALRWFGNRLIMQTAANGTGTPRDISIVPGSGAKLQLGAGGTENTWQIASTGHFLAGTDNTYDIGASGATRPRNIFVGSSVVNKTKAGTPTDSDVTNPADGMLIVDTTANKIWVRTGGAWKSVAVA